MSELNVGDKLFSDIYLNYIGNKDKWLQINYQPFYTVSSISGDYFSHSFSDVGHAMQAQCNYSEIFDIETGKSRKHSSDAHMFSVTQNKDKITDLINEKHQKALDKEFEYSNKRIEQAKREIAKLEQEQESFRALCDGHRDYLLNELDT